MIKHIVVVAAAAVALVYVMVPVKVLTKQDQVDLIMKKHLPPFTTVTFMSKYDLQEKYNAKINGRTTRRGGAIYTYHIDTIAHPITLLHEFCHVLQWDFHAGYVHTGLEGCDHFNYDTVNEL